MFVRSALFAVEKNNTPTYHVPPVWLFLSKIVMVSKAPSSRNALAAAIPPGPPPIIATRLIVFWMKFAMFIRVDLCN